MNELFKKLCENIKLTSDQRDDARKKYTGVCKVIHSHFYTDEYNGDTKLLFGSYARVKRTAIRPISENQDVDVLFKIPQEVYDQYNAYQGNGQSALLQAVRNTLLNSRYSLTDKPKAWGKVILIKTSDGKHNVEVLPAFELDDGSFKIPNSENGGSWEHFNPRADIEKFRFSNEKSEGLTADLSRMIKRWKLNTPTLKIKSYEIENFVIGFLESKSYEERNYSLIVKDFFEYLYARIFGDDKSKVESVLNRSVKALEYEEQEGYLKASNEWQKIFGEQFPLYKEKRMSGIDLENKIAQLNEKYPSSNEEYLDAKYGIPIVLDGGYVVEIDADVDQKGFRKSLWSEFVIKKFPVLKSSVLNFKIVSSNVPEPYEIKWKVRNYGEEAKHAGKLRGEISEGNRHISKQETSRYYGDHYVECYFIKENTCVAIGRILVPIANN